LRSNTLLVVFELFITLGEVDLERCGAVFPKNGNGSTKTEKKCEPSTDSANEGHGWGGRFLGRVQDIGCILRLLRARCDVLDNVIRVETPIAIGALVPDVHRDCIGFLRKSGELQGICQKKRLKHRSKLCTLKKAHEEARN
jgi:hypothetical protein